MRKALITVLAAVLGSVLVFPMVQAGAAKPDTKRACADIVDGRATYFSTPDTTNPTGSEVLAQMDLRGNACPKIRYTMTVLSGNQDQGVVDTVKGVTTPGTYTTPPRAEFTLALPWPGADGQVCIYITTSKPGGKVLDRAPDANCVLLPIDSDVTGALKFR
jgi:hypothetical protein